MKANKISDKLAHIESEIYRISFKVESIGSLLERQAASPAGCEYLMGIGFELEDMGKALREISDSVGTLAGDVK